MTDNLEAITEKIQKLLSLGRRGGTPAEAAAAMAKAQKLLTEHNLDMAAVDSHVEGSARREKTAQAGGMYVYQRDLWASVARLNFCLHFRRHQPVYTRRKKPEYEGQTFYKEEMGVDDQIIPEGYSRHRTVWRNVHMIVGRTVNVRATIALGSYLEQVVDRLCRERLTTTSGAGATPGELNSQFFSSWAVAYREGISDEVIKKLEARRQKIDDKERKAAREAQRRAEASGSTATTLTVAALSKREHDGNIDFLYGEGTAAEWEAERAERARERAEEEARRAQLARDNPEAYAAEEREREKQARRYSGRSAPQRRVNAAGYWAGRDAGEKVGIDPQTEGSRVAGRLR